MYLKISVLNRFVKRRIRDIRKKPHVNEHFISNFRRHSWPVSSVTCGAWVRPPRRAAPYTAPTHLPPNPPCSVSPPIRPTSKWSTDLFNKYCDSNKKHTSNRFIKQVLC